MPKHTKKAKGGMRYKAKKGSKTKTNLKGNEKTKTRVVGQKRANRMVKSTRRQAAKQDRIALHGMDTSHPQIARYGMKPKPQMSKMGSKLAPDNNYDMLDKQQS